MSAPSLPQGMRSRTAPARTTRIAPCCTPGRHYCWQRQWRRSCPGTCSFHAGKLSHLLKSLLLSGGFITTASKLSGMSTGTCGCSCAMSGPTGRWSLNWTVNCCCCQRPVGVTNEFHWGRYSCRCTGPRSGLNWPSEWTPCWHFSLWCSTPTIWSSHHRPSSSSPPTSNAPHTCNSPDPCPPSRKNICSSQGSPLISQSSFSYASTT